IVDSTSAAAVVPATFLDDGPGSRTVTGRIKDKDGGFTDYTTTIPISNVAPTASVTGPAGRRPGQPPTFTPSAPDPSAAPPTAGFTYKINWGDGTPLQTVNGSGAGVGVSHTFAVAGAYTVQVTATDKDGGVSPTAATSVAVTSSSAVSLQPDPCDPTKTALVVNATAGDDIILVWAGPAPGSVVVVLNDAVLGPFSPTGHVRVFGLAGDDVIIVAGNVTLSVWLDGGAGDDFLHGGAGPDLLLGGDGD